MSSKTTNSHSHYVGLTLRNRSLTGSYTLVLIEISNCQKNIIIIK